MRHARVVKVFLLVEQEKHYAETTPHISIGPMTAQTCAQATSLGQLLYHTS